MDNVLNRRLFNMGGAVTPGLDAFKGKALQARGMPMNGIMGFAEGGNPEVEKTKVADAYKMSMGSPEEGGVREGSFLDYITRSDPDGLRGDIASMLGEIGSIPYQIPVAIQEEMGVVMPEGYESQALRENITEGLSNLMGVTDPQVGDELAATAENIVKDPQLSEAAQGTVKTLAENLAKADANEDVNAAILAGAGEPISDDPAENRKNLGQRIRDIASGMGIELTEEDADPQTNPHIGMTLLLASSKIMQSKSPTTAGAIGEGLETGASYLANKAEKEAERKASNLNKLQQIALQEGLEAELGTGSTGGTASVLQEADRLQAIYESKGIPVPQEVTYRMATRSATADPAARVAAATKQTMEQDTVPFSVAQNYANIQVNAAMAIQDIQKPDLPIAYSERMKRNVTASELPNIIQSARQQSGNKDISEAEALQFAKVTPLSVNQMLSIAFKPKK